MVKLAHRRVNFFMHPTMIGIIFFLSSCGQTVPSVGVSYTPPFVPITFTIDTSGTISVQGNLSIETPVGTFTLEADVADTLQPENNTLLLIIRHKQNGTVVDNAYKIQIRQDEVTIVTNGTTTIDLTQHKVFIDASKGDIKSIELRGVNSDNISSPPASTTSEDTPVPTPTLTDLGGIPDLGGYCQSRGYDDVSQDGNTARDWHCVRNYHDVNINMSAACNWTYRRNDLTAHTDDYSDPNSWTCYTPQNENIGGIPDLGGFCQFRGYIDISRDGGTARDWHCVRQIRADIDMTKACQWQYKRNDVIAHTDNYNDPNSWQCNAPG